MAARILECPENPQAHLAGTHTQMICFWVMTMHKRLTAKRHSQVLQYRNEIYLIFAQYGSIVRICAMNRSSWGRNNE